jgi:hypothetical protein
MAQVKGDDGQSGVTPDAGYGVWGDVERGYGVVGTSQGGLPPFPIQGQVHSSAGVYGQSTSAAGVEGKSTSDVGVRGESQQTDGVSGLAHASAHSGVWGNNDGGGVGVAGSSTTGFGVLGSSAANDGVHGVCNGGNSGIAGISTQGTGVYGRGAKNAGQFDGNVQVNGTLTVTVDIKLANGDCAEEFDVVAIAEAQPGMVMVLDHQGALQPSMRAYDRKVAGIISGAGDYRPGFILDTKDSSEGRMPLALLGKVYCKVDAQYASIEVGDLLTTSPTLGHAMKAEDPSKAFGAVIGKALGSMQAGHGMIPVLVGLQ